MSVFTPGGLRIAHDDHNLSEAHLRLVDEVFAGRQGFVLTVVDLPEDVPSLPSALYGPAAGDAAVGEDDVEYVVRGNRRGPSRLVDRPHRPSRRMVVIGIAGGDAPLVYTAYGTQAEASSPREPWDARSDEERVSCEAFWAEHALAK